MTAPKHTPGPWSALMFVPSKDALWPKDDGTGIHVTESQTDTEVRLTVRSSVNAMRNLMGSALGGVVAEVVICYGGEETALEEAKANARLLAAAPDLFEALTAVMRLVDAHDDRGPRLLPESEWRQAKDALEKARGVQ